MDLKDNHEIFFKQHIFRHPMFTSTRICTSFVEMDWKLSMGQTLLSLGTIGNADDSWCCRSTKPKIVEQYTIHLSPSFAKVPTKKRETQIVSSAKTLPSTPGACAPCNLACRGKDLKALCEKEPWKRCQIELRKPRWYTLQIQRKTQSKCCFLVIHIWLVVSTPPWTILVSWDDYSQYMEK